MKNIKKNKKGSVLIFTMFIVLLSLITGIGLVTVSNSGRRSTLSSGKSINSFQIADSGLEAALTKIKDISTGSIDSVFSCNVDDEYNNNVSGGEYRVTFWNDSDIQLDCNQPVADIKKIKSIGTYKNTTRSVETTLLPSP